MKNRKFIVNMNGLDGAEVTIPAGRIPVFSNFDHRVEVGFTELSFQNNSVVAEITIENKTLSEELLRGFSAKIGGEVISRQGNIITAFKIKEVSLLRSRFYYM
jgi:hypothetical protein